MLLALAVAAVSATACSGHHKPPFSDGARGAIEHTLVSEGGTTAPVQDGTATGQLSIASPRLGEHVNVAVVCEGGGFLQITLNGKAMSQANCQSTYQVINQVGFSFAPYTNPTVIGLHPVKGQHWWAAISGPGGTRV